VVYVVEPLELTLIGIYAAATASAVVRCCGYNGLIVPINLYAIMRAHSSSVNLWKTQCTCAAARRAARALTQFYDLVLAPTGLKSPQLICLMEIAEAGEIAQWQLSRDNVVAPETLSRRLTLGSKKGLLKVRRGEKRGERIYSLTPYGHECLQKALPYWTRAQQRLAKALDDTAALEHLIDALDRLTLAAHAAEEIRTANSDGHRAPRVPAQAVGLDTKTRAADSP